MKRIIALVATLFVAAGLLVGLTPGTAQAASISIGGVVKTKGAIKTPTVKSSGVQVSSRSYVITKGKKTVTRTSVQGKAIKVKPGTYKVKSSVKYRTVTTKKTSKKVWMWDTDPRSSEATSTVGGWLLPTDNGVSTRRTGAVIDYDDERYEFPVEMRHSDGRKAVGWWSMEGPITSQDVEQSWPTSSWLTVNDPQTTVGSAMLDRHYLLHVIPTTTKVYGAWKTLTKTQTVKVSKVKPPYSAKAKCEMSVSEYNKLKKAMTVEQVRSIVGCKGQVDDIWKDNYDGEVHTTLHLMFSKNNKMPISGGVTGWVSFYDGHLYSKSHVTKNHSYSQYWSGV